MSRPNVPYRRMIGQPETLFEKTIYGILNLDADLGRPFTDGERFLVALLSSPPTHKLELHGPQEGPSLKTAWPLIRKRLERARTNPRPFIYLAVRAEGYGGGGDHMHVLSWDYLPAGSLVKHCRELGLGSPRINQLSHRDDPALLARPIGYVLGQHESVFGTDEHKRHKPRKKSQRRWTYPRRKTLAEHKPELLSAIEMAKSPSVSDKELLQRVPYLSRYTDEREEQL